MAFGSLALSANPAYTCYRGVHAFPGVLAWLVMLLHNVGFVLGSLWFLWPRAGGSLAKHPIGALQTAYSVPPLCFVCQPWLSV
jgi:hypothetical protein